MLRPHAYVSIQHTVPTTTVQCTVHLVQQERERQSTGNKDSVRSIASENTVQH